MEQGRELPRAWPQEAASAPYDWHRQWYAVAFVQDLDPARPTPIELLGSSLVLWRDAAKVWRCFEDRCPHRRDSAQCPCLLSSAWASKQAGSALSHGSLLERTSTRAGWVAASVVSCRKGTAYAVVLE